MNLNIHIPIPRKLINEYKLDYSVDTIQHMLIELTKTDTFLKLFAEYAEFHQEWETEKTKRF